MTHSVIHYWCLPEPGWWIIKPLIRPGNSASSSAADTHLHKSHAAIFHTLAHKHKHTPTRSHTHKVHRFWLALRCAWLTLFFSFFQELFQNTHISVIPGRGKLAWAANTEFRTGLMLLTTSSNTCTLRDERQYAPHPPDLKLYQFHFH